MDRGKAMYPIHILVGNFKSFFSEGCSAIVASSARHQAFDMEHPLQQPKGMRGGGVFGQFCSEKWSEISETPECKGKPLGFVTKEVSARFKALNKEQKDEWQEKYVVAKHEHKKKMEAFFAAGGKSKKVVAKKKRSGAKRTKAAKKLKKTTKDDKAPKKPAGGAYACFLAKNRPLFAKECEGKMGKSMTAIAKLAGTRWKELGAEEREPFNAEYKAKKAAYDEAKKVYMPSRKVAERAANGRQKHGKAAKAAQQGRKKNGRQHNDSAAPKKPVGGAYSCFVAKHRLEFAKECKGKPVTEISKLAGIKWKELDDKEKSVFQAEFDTKMTAYKAATNSTKKAQSDAVQTQATKKHVRKKTKVKSGSKMAKQREKQRKDAGEPKRPTGGGWGCFLAKNRQSFTEECNGKVAEVTKLAGARWKALGEEERNAWHAEYQARKAASNQEMEEFKGVRPSEVDGHKT